jgi:hypothetical protein
LDAAPAGARDSSRTPSAAASDAVELGRDHKAVRAAWYATRRGHPKYTRATL